MSIKSIYEKIGVFVEDNAKAVIAFSIIIMLLSFYGAGMIENKSGTDTFVKRTSEMYQNVEQYRQNFGSQTVVIMVESDDVTDSTILTAIDEFDKSITQDKDVKNVLSLATIVKTASLSTTGISEIPNDKVVLKKIIDKLPQQYLHQFLPDTKHTFIMVQMSGNVDTNTEKRVLNQVNKALKWTSFPAGTYITATGEPAYMIAMTQEMNSSLSSMLVLAFILMIIALLLVFRHVRWSLLPLPVVLIGLVWTFGAMGFLNIPMTMASMAVFPILIGLGADYAIQFHNRIEEELSKGESPAEAVIATLKHTGPAVGTAVIATCLGFVALFISSVPMIQDFGKMSLVGVILCYFASMFVLVPLLYILDQREVKKDLKKGTTQIKKNEQENSKLGLFLSKIAISAAKHPLIIVIIAASFAVMGLYADEHVGVQTDTKDFVPPTMKPLEDFNKLNKITGGSDQINIIVKAENVMDPLVLQWMHDFGKREVATNNQIIASSNMGSLINASYGSIPSDSIVLNSILEKIPAIAKDQYIEGNKMAVINLNIKNGLNTEQKAALIESVKKDLSWNVPPNGISTTLTGSMVAMTSIMDALTSGRTQMGYLGLAIIFGGMALIYRDFFKALVTVLPIFMVTGWSGGIMYLFGMYYNPLTATLGSLSIGIGAEFTILMMERYYEEREKGLEPFMALEKAASKIGSAIIASGLTVIFGFSALIVSSFPMLRDFGIVTVIAVTFSLFSTMVVLPPIMVTIDQWRINRNNNSNLNINFN